jgi:hypothetical protein
MPQITLNRDDAKKILDNPGASPDARLIAAFTIAFFESHDHAEDIGPDTRSIVLKLAHLSADAIYKGAE